MEPTSSSSSSTELDAYDRLVALKFEAMQSFATDVSVESMTWVSEPPHEPLVVDVVLADGYDDVPAWLETILDGEAWTSDVYGGKLRCVGTMTRHKVNEREQSMIDFNRTRGIDIDSYTPEPTAEGRAFVTDDSASESSESSESDDSGITTSTTACPPASLDPILFASESEWAFGDSPEEARSWNDDPDAYDGETSFEKYAYWVEEREWYRGDNEPSSIDGCPWERYYAAEDQFVPPLDGFPPFVDVAEIARDRDGVELEGMTYDGVTELLIRSVPGGSV